MKRIGIDCRFAGTHSGLGRYTRELVVHLVRRDDPVEYVLFVRSKNEDWLKAIHLPTVIETDFAHYSFSEQIRFPKIIKDAGIDLFFAPHFNVPLLCPVPFIVTIHDLILHRFPNQASFLRRFAYRFLMRHAIAKAQAVIAVSQFTADEICTEYGEALRMKLAVIGEGVSDDFVPQSADRLKSVCEKYHIDGPFFLYVGNAKQHKNVQMLLDVFVAAELSDMRLVLVSGGKEAARLRLPATALLLPDVPDNDLAALYSAARAFVTASLYEGFCLPIAEARACGCPVIATRRAAIPEIAGDESLLVEPKMESLANAMRLPPAPVESPFDPPSWDAVAERVASLF